LLTPVADGGGCRCRKDVARELLYSVENRGEKIEQSRTQGGGEERWPATVMGTSYGDGRR